MANPRIGTVSRDSSKIVFQALRWVMASSIPKVRSLSRHFVVDPDVIQKRVDVVSRRVVSMDSVRKGDALLELAQEHCRNFVEAINGQKMLGPDRVVTIGTGCTGSAADAFVFEAMEEAYREYLPDLSFEYKFNCESNEKKREWIVRLHDVLHNKGGAKGLCPGAVYVRRHY